MKPIHSRKTSSRIILRPPLKSVPRLSRLVAETKTRTTDPNDREPKENVVSKVDSSKLWSQFVAEPMVREDRVRASKLEHGSEKRTETDSVL